MEVKNCFNNNELNLFVLAHPEIYHNNMCLMFLRLDLDEEKIIRLIEIFLNKSQNITQRIFNTFANKQDIEKFIELSYKTDFTCFCDNYLKYLKYRIECNYCEEEIEEAFFRSINTNLTYEL